MDMNKKEYEALDKAAMEFFREGKTNTKCPRCGNSITVSVAGNSYTVKCDTKGCIKESIRGI